jgi:hypothetical protein
MLKISGDQSSNSGSVPRSRNRTITEKNKALLFLLREIPYITLNDIRRIFYPTHRTPGYTYEMVRVLTKNKLVGRYLLGNGVFIYYLTELGIRTTHFFMHDNIKFDSETKSFYYDTPPRRGCEAPAYFHFPSPDLDFKSFTPHLLHIHPFQHTLALLELYFLFRKSMRIYNVIWLDVVQHRKDSLSVPFHPDLLLANEINNEAHRIFVELENSVISCPNLIGKLDRLCSMPADWYFFLCTSEIIFRNLGQNIRKILAGEAKMKQKTLFVMPRTQSVLAKNLLIGIWKPSIRNKGEFQGLKDLALFRYDEEIFDKSVWMKSTDASGMHVKDVLGELDLRKQRAIPYPSRKPGKRKYLLGEILDSYSAGFRVALNKILAQPVKPPPITKE